MSIGKRIKAIRKALPSKATQEEFGAKLGVTRDVVTTYETGRVEPPEAMIRLICATHNISYDWLKYGGGQMFLSPDNDDELVERVMLGSNEFAKNTMKAFAKLSDDEWQLLKKIIHEIQKTGQ